MKNEKILKASKGGITFSGGEPLSQSEFILECIKLIDKRLNVAAQTSGFVDSKMFDNVLLHIDYCLMNPINEGPSFFVKNGVLFCVFSASESKCDDYCIGLLELRGNNPLDISCWQKYDKPVFAPTDNAKGIGHCSICLSDEIGYICYHVFKTDSSLGWENVFAVVQDFNFDANGKPIFGFVQYDRNKYLEGKYDFCRR